MSLLLHTGNQPEAEGHKTGWPGVYLDSAKKDPAIRSFERLRLAGG